jgi:hypothetical protein
MSIRSMLVAAAFALASLETAQADGLGPIDAMSIDLAECPVSPTTRPNATGSMSSRPSHKAWRERRSESCLFLCRASVRLSQHRIRYAHSKSAETAIASSSIA